MNKHILSPVIWTLINLSTLKAQIGISDGSFSYTEDFSTASSPSTLPNGWGFFENGTNANFTFSSGTGSSNAGDTYIFGSSNEWAFGGLQSGTLNPTFGVCFTNNTGSTITQFHISYDGETWRVGAADRSDRLDFQLNQNTTSIDGTGTWTDYNSLDYANPGQSTGSGSLQHSSNISGDITGLTIATGQTFCIRWQDFNASGGDDGMGVDNFNFNSVVLPIELTSFEAEAAGSIVQLKWTTASEKNNDYFVIEKSQDAKRFEAFGRIDGAGDSFDFITYHSTDESPFKGPNYYRLQQVDYDGSFTYSPMVSVYFNSEKDISVYPTLVGQEIHVGFSGDFSEEANAMVFDQVGRLVKAWKLSGDAQDNPLSVGDLDKGIYHLQVRTPGMNKTVKFFKQ